MSMAKRDANMAVQQNSWGGQGDDGTMSTITATDRVPVVAVCCGTTRSGKRRKLKLKKAFRKTMFWKRRNKYFDAEIGDHEAWAGDELEQQDSIGYFYFDAHEDLLNEYDYNLLIGDLSMRSKKNKGSGKAVPEELDDTSILTPKQKTTAVPIDQLTPETATIQQLLQELQSPTNKSPKTGQSGYPGGMSPEQLEQCEILLKGIERLKETSCPRIYEQVYSYLDVEDMPMAISRTIRATKFNAEEMLGRLESNQPQFEHAKSMNFYPNVDEAIGAPFSVFLSQYPFVGLGRSNQSLPVNYFQAGKINPEGIMALTTVDQLEGYYWWSFMHKFKRELREARLHPPDKPSFGLVEAVTIIDLQGLSASALSSETMDVIKLSSKIADFYPETLHKMLIVNAPGFFAMSWGLIKKFIDPQTASRIQIFSNKNKALKALQELVDIDEIPSDYGGNNKTIKEALMQWSTDPMLIRQEIELLHIKRRGKASGKQTWHLGAGERVDISVFTRSASAAKIRIKVDDNEVQSLDANHKLENDVIKSNSYKIDLGDLAGPCTIALEGEDLDTVDKKHAKESRGYFLVVGDIKKVE